ncbi:MAG TPA: long-chain fatty acid--CoA ligase [Xanthobacteraceae bacterium]
MGAERADPSLFAAHGSVRVDELVGGSSLGGTLSELSGRSILVATPDQLTTALALIELDGLARRLIICPPDLADEHLAHIVDLGEADAVIHGPDGPRAGTAGIPVRAMCSPRIAPAREAPSRAHETEWILLTSGTTGVPKMVVHTLATLTAAVRMDPDRRDPVVWATFYDIRRYGGMQIFLRAMLGRASLVLSSAGESTSDHLHRLARLGVTHLTGTPSHWRWAILNPAACVISPRYVRLSGEIADQPILDSLREMYPSAGVAHAYASTEAGVGFAVNDGLEGFPASLIAAGSDSVQLKIIDGSLRIRSPGTALRYVGNGEPLLDQEGFVDTGDIVELRRERYFFIGRRGGIINVGGLKVHPEEIEAVINRHPEVRMSLVHGRKNPITGAVVVAEVVLRGQSEQQAPRAVELKQQILQACRSQLPQHKVPAAIRFVPTLGLSPAGKAARNHG